MILLQDLVFSNELEIACKGFNESEDILIFEWSSIPSIRHYYWLHDSIHWILFNNKVNYLVHTIWRILDFLQLWTAIVP